MRKAFTSLAIVALATTTFAACRTEADPCTPDSAGFGGWKALERTELLDAVTPGTSCNDHVQVIRSSAELRRALEEAKVPLLADNGTSPNPDAFELPKADYRKEVVVLREGLDLRGVKWLVTREGTVTVGLQGCGGSDTASCKVSLYAVPTSVTKAESHACQDIGCTVPTSTESSLARPLRRLLARVF